MPGMSKARLKRDLAPFVGMGGWAAARLGRLLATLISGGTAQGEWCVCRRAQPVTAAAAHGARTGQGSHLKFLTKELINRFSGSIYPEEVLLRFLVNPMSVCDFHGQLCRYPKTPMK